MDADEELLGPGTLFTQLGLVVFGAHRCYCVLCRREFTTTQAAANHPRAHRGESSKATYLGHFCWEIPQDNLILRSKSWCCACARYLAREESFNDHKASPDHIKNVASGWREDQSRRIGDRKRDNKLHFEKGTKRKRADTSPRAATSPLVPDSSHNVSFSSLPTSPAVSNLLQTHAAEAGPVSLGNSESALTELSAEGLKRITKSLLETLITVAFDDSPLTPDTKLQVFLSQLASILMSEGAYLHLQRLVALQYLASGSRAAVPERTEAAPVSLEQAPPPASSIAIASLIQPAPSQQSERGGSAIEPVEWSTTPPTALTPGFISSSPRDTSSLPRTVQELFPGVLDYIIQSQSSSPPSAASLPFLGSALSRSLSSSPSSSLKGLLQASQEEDESASGSQGSQEKRINTGARTRKVQRMLDLSHRLLTLLNTSSGEAGMADSPIGHLRRIQQLIIALKSSIPLPQQSGDSAGLLKLHEQLLQFFQNQHVQASLFYQCAFHLELLAIKRSSGEQVNALLLPSLYTFPQQLINNSHASASSGSAEPLSRDFVEQWQRSLSNINQPDWEKYFVNLRKLFIKASTTREAGSGW